MQEHDLKCNLTNKHDVLDKLQIRNVEEMFLNVEEKFIDNNKARTYFKNVLSKCFVSDIPPDNFASIDSIVNYLKLSSEYTVINCTYNHLNPIDYGSYELFISLIYTSNISDVCAITIMDGPFFSIYPYNIEKHLYTVTSVEHGVIYSGKDIINYTLDEATLLEKKTKIELLMDEYLEDWRSHFVYSDFFLSWKTKPVTTNDDRDVKIMREGNIVNIYGGKITGIFKAEQYIESII